jgi:hypothetical protein
VRDLGHCLFKNKEVSMTTGPGAVPRFGDPVAHQSGLSSAASPNQVFYNLNTKVDGEDNGPQRDGALRQPGRSSERVVSVR